MSMRQDGFTLLELVVVIVVVGILATMTSNIITLPVRGYFDVQRRMTLADDAEAIFWIMQRDLRRALPNSVRITGSGQVLELLRVSEGARYRAQTGAGSGDILDFTSADSSFDVMGTLSASPSGLVAIYNLGDFSANAYTGNNVANVANTSTTTRIVMSPAKLFPRRSPQQRFFLIDTPVTYRCDTTSGLLMRYSGYTISATQPNPPSGGTAAIQADNVASCQFTYASSSASRNGLITIQITLRDTSGEATTIVHQVHVDNSP